MNRRWMMVAIAFISQGVAYGFTFGMAGTFVGPAGDEFAASRVATTLGTSLVALLHGLLGPVVGVVLARRSIRSVMMTGAVLMAAAFLTMHFATSIWMFSLAFGLLGGAAVSCLGMTPVTALVGRWFPTQSGRALGIAFMPILVTVLPPIAGYLNAHFGWRTTALAAALCSLALVPLFRLVRDPPVPAAGGGIDAAHVAHAFALPDRNFRPDRAFWMLALAVGIFDGGAIAMITHVIPHATESGIGYQRATLLISAMGLSGLAGAPLLGSLADRIGGAWTLALVALLLAAGWAVFAAGAPFLALAGAMALLGFCGGAFAALAGTSLATRYQGASLGPAVGFAVLVAMPFNFLLPLLGGWLHDRTGNYHSMFVVEIGLLAIAFAMLIAAARSGAYAIRR